MRNLRADNDCYVILITDYLMHTIDKNQAYYNLMPESVEYGRESGHGYIIEKHHKA